MSTVKDIYSFLDGLYPRTLSCEWDNDGLMVCRNSEREVKRVLLALDVTRKVADEAISGGYDLIISHHPLIFRPLKQLSEEYSGALIPMKLFSAGVSVISLHTRFDAGEGGINDTPHFSVLTLSLRSVRMVKNAEDFAQHRKQRLTDFATK